MNNTRTTRTTDTKGEDLDFEFMTPTNGRLPPRRVEPTCLLDIATFV